MTEPEPKGAVGKLRARTDTPPRASRPPAALETLAAYSWRLLVVAAAAVLLGYVVVLLRVVVLPIIVAIFGTTLLGPLVERLRNRGWPSGRATAVVFFGALVALVALIALLAPQVGEEVPSMGQAIRQGTDRALEYLTGPPLNLSEAQVDSFVDRAAQELAQNRDEITSGVLVGAVKVGEFITGVFLTAFLLFFFLKDGRAIWRWLTGQLEQPLRGHVHNIGARILGTMGAYLRGIATVGLIEGTAIGIVLLIVGVPLIIPLVLLQFFAAFFPVVGALVAGVIATLVALVAGGFADALIVGAAILVIQQADNHLLQPLIMGRAVKLHPIAVILALAAGGVVAGIVGALLGVPLAAVAATMGNYINGLRRHDSPSFSDLQRQAP